MRDIRNLLLIFVISFFGACSYYNEKNPGDVNTITANTVSWSRISNEFFQPRCAICHSQGGAGVNTSTYSSVLTSLHSIQNEVLVRHRMPPDSPITDYERTLLTVWIQQGTPFEAKGANH